MNEAYKYSIESVRVPAERIQLYKTGATAGPWDIALIRLRDSVPFIPHKVAPVSQFKQLSENLKVITHKI